MNDFRTDQLTRLTTSSRLRTWLRWGGALLLVAGLQAWGFARTTGPLITEAEQQLEALQQEVGGNRLANLSLEALQGYWNAIDDEAVKREVLGVRDTVMTRFSSDPAAAVEELVRVTASLEARSVVEQEALDTLNRRVERLGNMYSDHFAAAITAYRYPPLYLQPTAGFLNNSRERDHSLAYNHALYLMDVRDTSGALEILDGLREEPEFETGAWRARLLFAMARLQFQAFQLDKDPAFFRESLQYAQQAARADADYALPKVFLEYLLSVDRNATQVDTAQMEGEGTGEGEGERGAIVTSPEDF